MEAKLYLDREETRSFNNSFAEWDYLECSEDYNDRREVERRKLKELFRSCGCDHPYTHRK